MENKVKKMKETNKEKREKIDNLIKTKEEERKKKIEEYFIDTEKKDQYVIINKLMKSQKMEMKKMNDCKMNQLVQGHKHDIELDHEQKRIDLKYRMDELDQRVTNYRKKVELESLKKLQESFVKQSEKDFLNQRMQRMKEYKYELKCKEIEDKEKRIEQMKNEQNKFREQKKMLNRQMQNEKTELRNKFNNLVKGKSKIDSEIVKKLYPDDEELYQKIKNMQKNYELNNNDNQNKNENYKTERDNRAKSASQKKKEEEIEKRVEEFRKILREEISKEIENERNKEKKRIKEYEEAKTVEDKKRIEQKNNQERKESNQKITDKNDNIEKYVDDYRKKLLNEAGIFH